MRTLAGWKAGSRLSLGSQSWGAHLTWTQLISDGPQSISEGVIKVTFGVMPLTAVRLGPLTLLSSPQRCSPPPEGELNAVTPGFRIIPDRLVGEPDGQRGRLCFSGSGQSAVPSCSDL